jgi:hypothetical protein
MIESEKMMFMKNDPMISSRDTEKVKSKNLVMQRNTKK